ncbi:MAG: M48 family metallopeptidase [Proteobacteria bacterium]|nr:M48 family metallopeptidase [Pseudomonadota bacterium]
MDISGNYFDGRSSHPCPAVLYRHGKGAGVLNPAGTCLAWVEDALSLNIASRVGDTKRFVRFPDGGVFETNDNDAIDRLAASMRHRTGLAHRLESRWRYAAIGLMVTLLFTWGSIQYGIPLLARVVAFSISAENNRRIGQGVLEALDKTIFSPSRLPPEEQERLRSRFLARIGAVDNIPLAIEFRQAEKNIGANAFALPSGTIIFTDQLVGLAQNDEELLGVFYHEAGHVQRRHALRGILQQSALAAVIVAVTGDASSVASLVSAAPAFLVEAGYSRQFEDEADGFAVARMREADLDPAHYARILTRLEEAKGGKTGEKGASRSRLNDYLSTHPATAERINQMKKQ